MTRYAKPETLDEALALLGDGTWRVVAGATDFYPALGNRPLQDDVLDINAIDGLRGIASTETHLILGASTTWTDVARTELPPAFDALRQAAREVGSIQIQNVASVAGNLCNASPAADGVPALLVLDAEVELRSRGAARTLPLGEFMLGNRRTMCRADELVTAVRIPKTATTGRSGFVKLGARRYLVISIAMAAARLVLAPDGRIAEAAIAVGACSPVARRLGGLETALVGHPPVAIEQIVRDTAFDELSPIDDIRGSAAYRHEAAREIVTRALCRATGDPLGRAAA